MAVRLGAESPKGQTDYQEPWFKGEYLRLDYSKESSGVPGGSGVSEGGDTGGQTIWNAVW